MKTLLYFLPLCTLLHFSDVTITDNPSTETPPAEKNFFRFGDQLVSLETMGTPSAKNYVLVGLHSNEAASLASMQSFSRATGAYFLQLQNNNNQKIVGSFLDKKISFDPQKIFTDWGRKEHLKDNNCWTKFIDLKVEQFSQFLLNELPYDKAVVSLHTHHARTIKDYSSKKSLAKQVKSLHRDATKHVAAYFITTDDSIFEKLKQLQYNVVLLHPKKVVNDGDLAVYCVRSKRPYVQIEAREEDAAEGRQMLLALDSILK